MRKQGDSSKNIDVDCNTILAICRGEPWLAHMNQHALAGVSARRPYITFFFCEYAEKSRCPLWLK